MKHHNKITATQPGNDPNLDQTVLSRLAALKAMSVKELKAEWEKLIGTSAPNNSRAFLNCAIAYRHSGTDLRRPRRETRACWTLLADEVEGHARAKHQIADPRNPCGGTKASARMGRRRAYRDRAEGRLRMAGHANTNHSPPWPAHITGTRWNGYRFFGLAGTQAGGGMMDVHTPAPTAACAAPSTPASRARKASSMEFNSLDAQREACEAYIASQKSEGWVAGRDQL